MQRSTEKIKPRLSTQMKDKSKKKDIEYENDGPYEGDFGNVISTGSTLLDLAISGSRVRGGGLPGGIVVEASGPSQSGKTALLTEIAGQIERKGGDSQFNDPEARLDEEFARLFGMKLEKKNYHRPDTVTELFSNIIAWQPKPTKENAVNAIFGDSLAALSTNIEMGEDEGDKMGMRRAKEFSEGLRKTCRLIKQRNLLLVCSNQIRINVDAGKYGQKYNTPGGEAFKFYSTVRLRFNTPSKIKDEKSISGKKVEKVIGMETEIEVIKTCDTPFRKANLVIIYGYGIDDIRANLQYIKTFKGYSQYFLGGNALDKSMEEAIKIVEDDIDLVKELREETIDLWEEIEEKFKTTRKKIRI